MIEGLVCEEPSPACMTEKASRKRGRGHLFHGNINGCGRGMVLDSASGIYNGSLREVHFGAAGSTSLDNLISLSNTALKLSAGSKPSWKTCF